MMLLAVCGVAIDLAVLHLYRRSGKAACNPIGMLINTASTTCLMIPGLLLVGLPMSDLRILDR